MINLKKIIRRPSIQLLLFCLAAYLLFFPILHKSFGGDDFSTLKRVALDRVLWIKGFFRPLSDITLFFNYLLGGFDPAGYYLFNILLHGVNSFLLFHFCRRWRWAAEGRPGDGMSGHGRSQGAYAFIAALLFLTYPFHNESIVWGLGRASIVANFFGMAALLVTVSGLRPGRKIQLVCLFYFIGMLSYESIMLLPLMIFVILYGRRAQAREYIPWGIALGATLLIHLSMRIVISGGLMGSYGGGFFSSGWGKHFGNLPKVFGRMFLPPSDEPRLMMLLLAGLAFSLYLVVLLFLKRHRQEPPVKSYLLKLSLLLAIACVVPVLSGISTRTSEGDRLLYFPSYFLCCGAAFLMVMLIRSRNLLYLLVFILVIYNVVWLEKNNRNWLRASVIAGNVLDGVARQEIDDHPQTLPGHGRKIFVVNVPDELDGAFIFRQGLPEALQMKGLTISGLVIVNVLKRDQSMALPDSIVVTRGAEGEWQIAPVVTISRAGADSLVILGRNEMNGDFRMMAGKGDVVLYWNKKNLLVLEH
jgi:hypothetical protein